MFSFSRSTAAAVGLAVAFACGPALALASTAPQQIAIPANSPNANIAQFTTGSTNELSVVWNPANTESLSSTYVDVGGMSTQIKVPSGRKAVLVSRFSAEAACIGNLGNWCSIRILVDGHEAAPATDFGFAFTTVNPAAPGGFMWESCSMDRVYTVGSGTHTVTVQEANTDTSGETIFWLGERTLTVQSALL